MTELHDLLHEVLTSFSSNISNFDDSVIIKRHQGGKQTFAVFECNFQNKKVAVKLYKPIITHLIVHTVAREYILNNPSQFDHIYNPELKLNFPDTIALGQTVTAMFHPSISVLVQDWIENKNEIHKVFPKNHVSIIKSILKKLTSENGFMVDIMSKNWLASSDDLSISYTDLILFNPKGQILEQIKFWASKLE